MKNSAEYRNLPNLRHLNAALEIQRVGSVSKASLRVYMSQSALTQAIARLEQNLNFVLFNRSPSGLFPTDEGRIYLHRVERALNWLKMMDNVLATRFEGSNKRRHQFTTSQLRALLTVVEERSYTLAANRLNLSQPTVHRAVHDLEAHFGQGFFQRSPAGVEPTWLARQLARYISLYFSELSQGLDEVSEHQGKVISRLRVGSLPLSRTHMIPHTVTQLLNKFPEAKVSIIDGPYEEQLHSLLHGQLDVIVGALRSPNPSPDTEQEFLFNDPLSIVVRPGHKLAQKKSLTANQLREIDWIAPRANTPAREAFTRFFVNKGLQPPEHLIECSSMVATRGLLLESERAALLPARQVEVEIQKGLLVISPQKLSGTNREIGLTLRRHWQPTQVQAYFLQLLRDYN